MIIFIFSVIQTLSNEIIYYPGIDYISYYEFIPEIYIRGRKPKILLNGYEIKFCNLGSSFVDFIPIDILQIKNIEIIKTPTIYNGINLSTPGINIIPKDNKFNFRAFAGGETGDPLIFKYIRPLDSLPNKERIGPSGAFTYNYKGIEFCLSSERYCTLYEGNKIFRERISPNFYEWTYQNLLNIKTNNIIAGIKTFSGWRYVPILDTDMLLNERNSLLGINHSLKGITLQVLATNSAAKCRKTLIIEEGEINHTICRVQIIPTKFYRYRSQIFSIYGDVSYEIVDASMTILPKGIKKFNYGVGLEKEFKFKLIEAIVKTKIEPQIIHSEIIKYKNFSLTHTYTYEEPTIYQLYSDIKINNSFGLIGNDKLSQEKIQGVDFSYYNKYFRLSLFANKIKNYIEEEIIYSQKIEELNTTLKLKKYKNIAQKIIYGTELEVNSLLPGIKIFSNYSFTNNTPIFIQNIGNIKCSIEKEILTNIYVHFIKNYNTIFPICDLSIGKKFIKKRLNIEIYGVNIFNKKYIKHIEGKPNSFQVFLSIYYIL